MAPTANATGYLYFPTGSSACGINKSGDSAHSGGWGYLLGDEGGGYWLGMQTLKAVANVADGFEVKTELYQKLFHHLNISHLMI